MHCVAYFSGTARVGYGEAYAIFPGNDIFMDGMLQVGKIAVAEIPQPG